LLFKCRNQLSPFTKFCEEISKTSRDLISSVRITNQAANQLYNLPPPLPELSPLVDLKDYTGEDDSIPITDISTLPDIASMTAIEAANELKCMEYALSKEMHLSSSIQNVIHTFLTDEGLKNHFTSDGFLSKYTLKCIHIQTFFHVTCIVPVISCSESLQAITESTDVLDTSSTASAGGTESLGMFSKVEGMQGGSCKGVDDWNVLLTLLVITLTHAWVLALFQRMPIPWCWCYGDARSLPRYLNLTV
jgi:hypothetical protein